MNKTTIRLPENITSESEGEIEVTEEVKSPLPRQEKLDRPIKDEINAQITVKTRRYERSLML